MTTTSRRASLWLALCMVAAFFVAFQAPSQAGLCNRGHPCPSPSPSPSPSAGCYVVAAGTDLSSTMSAKPAGTTYCLAAGTFRVTTTITTQQGDSILGAGRDATFIDGTGLSSTSPGIFVLGGDTSFQSLDVFGAPTPPAGVAACSPASYCGAAFRVSGGTNYTLSLTSVDCHDNGGNCVSSGNGSLLVEDLDCWSNGNAYSMTAAFRYAACIKRGFTLSTGSVMRVTNSSIHDNPWIGLWCDFCKQGYFDVENNLITDNGAGGIQWEMSGGWSSNDHALVAGNTFHGNNWSTRTTERGGVNISSSNDIEVRNNTFGSNYVSAVAIGYTASRNPPQPDSRGVWLHDNVLNGDSITGCSLAGVVCS